jgi:hypothetical protein
MSAFATLAAPDQTHFLSVSTNIKRQPNKTNRMGRCDLRALFDWQIKRFFSLISD